MRGPGRRAGTRYSFLMTKTISSSGALFTFTLQKDLRQRGGLVPQFTGHLRNRFQGKGDGFPRKARLTAKTPPSRKHADSSSFILKAYSRPNASTWSISTVTAKSTCGFTTGSQGTSSQLVNIGAPFLSCNMCVQASSPSGDERRKCFGHRAAQGLHTEQKLRKGELLLFILFLRQPTIYFLSV